MYSPSIHDEGARVVMKSSMLVKAKPVTAKRNKSTQKPGAQESALMIRAPVASARVRRMSNPRVTNLSKGDCRIVHREYITDIAGSVAFTTNQFQINPGVTGVFPWLSAIAVRYESYLFEKLRFCFETESATSATGTVLLAIDYDASDSAPESKTQAMSYRSSVRSPPWSDSCLDSLREDLTKRKSYYVRNGSLASNQDIKLYDVGNLFVCLQGQAGTTTVGELYVEYDVRLMTPQINAPSFGEALYGTFAGTSNASPFGSVASSGNLPVGYVSTGSTTSVTTFTFTQPWAGLVGIALNGTGIGATTISGTATVSTEQSTINAGTTASTSIFAARANIGQTVIISNSNTTISSGLALFAQGSFV